ncbi:MAG: metalloprotease TldD [Alphaproteobacteria bacterium]|nr:MAG: metalloprotease TldD [Alphaproteobacteria bacterium]
MARAEDGTFRPYETQIDQETAERILKDALRGADDGELFLERSRAETLVFDDGRLRNASYDAAEGFGLRAVSGEATGFAHANEISEAALRRAAETVRLAVRDGATRPAPGPAPTNRRLYADSDPIAEGAFGPRVELLREIDAFARALDPRVIQVSASLSSSFQEVLIHRLGGQIIDDRRPLVHLRVSVIVEKDGRRETGSAATGGRHELSRITTRESWKALVREALRVALVNLEAEPAPAGVMDVVLGPGWPGILLHEAIGHGLEGDFNRKGTSAFAGLLGKRVAAPGVTVVDDGTIPERRGSISVDDEGTPSGRNVLIEDGILVGYMQDRQNARLMGVAPTGNGRRQSHAHMPMPRMTNTIMEGGDSTPEALLGELRDGIHAVGFGGGQVDITNGKFVFSCTEAYRVKNGRVLGPVKGATLIGDGPTVLRHVRGVANDMALDPGMGTCGKAGQWVPVGVGQPTVLIGGLTVGGSGD